MTLQELFDYLAENPTYLILYFIMLPLAALVAGWLDQNRGHYNPWSYIYTFLIYGSCIPGIFSIALNVYLFLFERHSIYQTDLYTQVLPWLSMVVTLLIIRRNVDLDYVPGFDRLSGLIMILGAVMAVMWFFDRTHIIAFIHLRWQVVLAVFLVLIAIVYFGSRRLFGSSYQQQ